MNDSAFKRVLLLFGAYTLVNNVTYLVGYYFLPEGLLRGTPVQAAARTVASAGSFAGEFALTLLFNLGLVILVAGVTNLFRVRDFPVGYLIPVIMGVSTGLITGTNSFLSAGAMDYPLREGMALGLSIGVLEMLGYICVIAATVKLGIFREESWWRGKTVRTGRLRDVRLDRAEIIVLVAGLLLVVAAAYRETLDAWHML